MPQPDKERDPCEGLRKRPQRGSCPNDMAGATFAEEEIGRKWDRCLTDSLFKIGGGIATGGVFSLLFFKRRGWPLLIGAGFGLGVAYANCERDLNAIVAQQSPNKLLA